MARRQRDELFASGVKEHILCDEKRARTLLNKRSEGGVGWASRQDGPPPPALPATGISPQDSSG